MIKYAWLPQETLYTRQITNRRIQRLHERSPLLRVKPEALTVGQQQAAASPHPERIS